VTAQDPGGVRGAAPAGSITIERVVTPDDTASALGSGDVPVLATPRLLAWAEAATVALLAGRLPAGSTSVGTRIELDHLAASPLGATVRVTATLLDAQGRGRRFTVTAVHPGDGRVVARGTVTRAVVDRQRFVTAAQP
jgi:predicted thioesterase